MISMHGKLLIFDKEDSCGRVFPSNCKITFPEKIPVTSNFSSKPKDVLGHASIIRETDCISCNVQLNDYISDELYIGGYYNRISQHMENELEIIDSANLCAISVIPKENSVDYDQKITLKEKRND